MWKPLLGFLLLVTTTSCSYCGTSGAPFSLEILPTGVPVLGCAQPTCMAGPIDNEDDSLFHLDAQGQPDGYFREGDRLGQAIDTNKARANCSGEFNHLACTKKNQWVGGIEYIDHPRQPLVLQCCSFQGLRFSQDVGVTTISAGEAVTGGEVIRDGRQISFDVIANVRKVVDPDDPQLVSFEVTVRRMNCLPDPPEIETPFDDDVEGEVLRVLEKSSDGLGGLGHEGHPHSDLEEELRGNTIKQKSPKKYQRKNAPLQSKKSSEHTDFVVGSFGAPIYNPEPEQTDPSDPSLTPTPKPSVHPRFATVAPLPQTEPPPPPPTRKPRRKVRVSPAPLPVPAVPGLPQQPAPQQYLPGPQAPYYQATAPPPLYQQTPPPLPPQQQIQQVTPAPLPVFTFPTLPPFTLPTLAPPQPLFQQPHPAAYGVAQATVAPQQPAPNPFALFQQQNPWLPFGLQQPFQPPAQPQQQIVQQPLPQAQFGQPFGQLQPQQPLAPAYGTQTQPQQIGVGGGGSYGGASNSHELPQYGIQQQQVSYAPQNNIFNPFAHLQTPAYQQPVQVSPRQEIGPRPQGVVTHKLKDHPASVERSDQAPLAPQRQQLDNLFQPPMFSNLGSTLQNFQAQG